MSVLLPADKAEHVRRIARLYPGGLAFVYGTAVDLVIVAHAALFRSQGDK